MSEKLKKGLVFGIGALLVVLGGIVGAFWDQIFNKILTSELVLTPTSKSFELWKDIPIPMYLDFYMYNWTNSEEVLADPSVKPHVVELGPYVFRERHVRENLIWNDDNNTVTYMQKRTWHFVEAQSKGSLDDEITNINVIATTTASIAQNLPSFLRMLINVLLGKTNSTLTVTKTVRELLFDGYDDPFLDLANQLNTSFVNIPFKRFGYFVDRNNSVTYDGVFNMYTGSDDLEKLGILVGWNYKKKSPFYGSPCSKIKGTSGELWPPMKKESDVSLFIPDLCIALDLAYTSSTEYQGIPGYHFVGDKRTLDTGTIDPNKSCQCVGVCQPTGTLNVSLCRFNAPLFVSFPHFYLADPFYEEQISGLDPSKENHEFTFGMEPVTGVPLYVNGRVQLNMLLKAYQDITMFQVFKGKTLFLPLLWFNQRVRITEDLAEEIKVIANLPAIGMSVFFGIAGIGALMLFVATMLTIRHGWKGAEGEELLVHSQ